MRLIRTSSQLTKRLIVIGLSSPVGRSKRICSRNSSWSVYTQRAFLFLLFSVPISLLLLTVPPASSVSASNIYVRIDQIYKQSDGETTWVYINWTLLQKWSPDATAVYPSLNGNLPDNSVLERSLGLNLDQGEYTWKRVGGVCNIAGPGPDDYTIGQQYTTRFSRIFDTSTSSYMDAAAIPSTTNLRFTVMRRTFFDSSPCNMESKTASPDLEDYHVQPIGTADLTIIVTSSPNPAVIDSNITYTITITNNGPATAQSVTVADNLPTSTTFVSCSSTGGGVCGGTGNNLAIAFTSLSVGSSATITLIATIDASVRDGSVIRNTATVSAPTIPLVAATVATTTRIQPIKNVRFSSDATGPFVTFDLSGPILTADQSDRFYLQIFFNRDAPAPTGNSDVDLFAADFIDPCGVPSYYTTTTRVGSSGGIGGNYATDSWIQSPWTFNDPIANNFPYHYKLYFAGTGDSRCPGLDLRNTQLSTNDFISFRIIGYFFGNRFLEFTELDPHRYFFTPPACVTPPPGIIGWWPANGDANDLIGGNNGTLQNGVTFAAGHVGQAFSFDGVDDVVTVPDAPSLDFGSSSPMTIELWAYRTGSATTMHLIGKRVNCSLNDFNYQMAFDPTNGLLFGGDLQNGPVTTGQQMPLNTWMHLAGTFDGTTFRLYINGALAGSSTGILGPINSTPLKIGNAGSCNPFGGLIDEVTLYNRSLAASEIQAIFNAGGAGKCRGFLAFPLKGISPGVDEKLDPYRAPINSVFDHSMRCFKKANDPKCRVDAEYRIYGCDQNVEAFTDELGNLDPSSKNCKIVGYAQDTFHKPFFVNGHYTGAGDVWLLNYDGHPGFDYRARFGTEVYAASSGTVRYPTLSELEQQNTYIGGDPDKFNALELDPGNGYKIYYLHLSTHPRTISLYLAGNVTGQDFIATKIGTPGASTPGTFQTEKSFSISGRITLNGKPLSGVTVTLQGTGACPALEVRTNVNGNYRFSGLPAGFYHVRSALTGYTFRPAIPNVVIQDGTMVDAGTKIALSGNAGPCLPPHLHFEVQKRASESVMKTTSLHFIPVDPYGWDGDSQDPYEQVPGVRNNLLWSHVPVVDNISPASVSAGIFNLTISGRGFDSGAFDCIIMKSNDYSNPSCIRGIIQSRTAGQLVVKENLDSGTYFVHVENGDGRRSNWKKLVVQ